MNYFLYDVLPYVVGNAPDIGTSHDEKWWDALYVQAAKHSVVGVVASAVLRLPQSQYPDMKSKIRFAISAECIEEKNAESLEKNRELCERVRSLGFESCVLKGAGSAILYPQPEFRQCGDIDLWVKDDRGRILDVVSREWKIGKVFYHHGEVDVFGDKFPVELHFKPTWMNNPFRNRRLQDYFNRNWPLQKDNFNEKLGFAVATTGFGLVFSLVHIFRHLLSEGVGVRQMMDYYYILQSSSPSEREEAMVIMKSLGLGTFTAAVMGAQVIIFKAPRSILLCRPDMESGKFLAREIAISGNFGKYDPRLSFKLGIFGRIRQNFCRQMRFFSLGWRDIIWTPAFKVWQFLWRKTNKY